MKPIIVDASVAVKWFIPESDSDQAIKYLNGRHRLAAPDLIHIEVANTFWKLSQRGVLSDDEALGLIRDFLLLPLEIYDSHIILASAMEIATNTQRTVYDSLYLALALELNGTVVTADTRMVNALKRSPFSHYLRLLA